MSKATKPGFKNALEILTKLLPQEQERILENISSSDPKLAQELKRSFYKFEDLKYLDQKMLANFIKDIDIELFSLALRGANKEMISHVLNNVSKNTKADINEILLGPPQPVEKVMEAIDKIMFVVLKKINSGEITISKDSGETIID